MQNCVCALRRDGEHGALVLGSANPGGSIQDAVRSESQTDGMGTIAAGGVECMNGCLLPGYCYLERDSASIRGAQIVDDAPRICCAVEHATAHLNQSWNRILPIDTPGEVMKYCYFTARIDPVDDSATRRVSVFARRAGELY